MKFQAYNERKWESQSCECQRNAMRRKQKKNEKNTETLGNYQENRQLSLPLRIEKDKSSEELFGSHMHLPSICLQLLKPNCAQVLWQAQSHLASNPIPFPGSLEALASVATLNGHRKLLYIVCSIIKMQFHQCPGFETSKNPSRQQQKCKNVWNLILPPRVNDALCRAGISFQPLAQCKSPDPSGTSQHSKKKLSQTIQWVIVKN